MRDRSGAQRALAFAGIVLASGLMLAACGIPMQDEPQPLPPGAVPGSISSPAP